MTAQMRDTMAKHEMDFLLSYKGHMHRVTKELERYKKALNEKEFMSRREHRLVKLQGQVEWFKGEALELSKRNMQLKTDVMR